MIPDRRWLDPMAYPFTSRYFAHGAGRMHYVDEGSGPPVLMLHGNPTWSFLYRHLIRYLAPSYRCIALDYLGFGLSEKPLDWSYRAHAHARTVETLVDALDLHDLTLVAQDWGGPIGCAYALRRPERVRRLVLMNTWMWPVDDVPRFRLFSKMAGGPLGRLLVRRLNAFVRVFLPLACRGRLTRAAYRHYAAPFRQPANRDATWIFPRELVSATAWLRQLWSERHALAGMPALLLWGMQDPAFREQELQRWLRLFPTARVQRLPHVGHYVPEELGPGLGPLVEDFLQATS